MSCTKNGIATVGNVTYGDDMSTREKLLAEIEGFLAGSGMAATEFGERIMGDRGLVRRLRSGLDVTTATADKCRALIKAHKADKEGAPRTRPRRSRRETEAAAL